ncbi:ABC transporter permease [Oceanobacillus bengalensis]|uniref:ABC transporter permease n=1 Tax=Oceanobacillus bengalensis TaxID=1435466 RepID=A0A494Z892_9BACI|nr:ABC transporter permease [Oceanobacillus bengalensis]RKQ18736.1 ABC transporter permease [Oceanobacillus bengalensis]
MIGILLAKFKTFIRNPWTFFIFTGMSIVFALMIGGTGGMSSIPVPVSSADDIKESAIGEALEENEVYTFNWMAEEEMKKRVSSGKAEAGVILKEDSYEVIVGVASSNVEMIEQTIQGVYVEKRQNEKLLEMMGADTESSQQEFLDNMEQSIESPVFSIEASSFRSADAVVHDSASHSLFGFTLFFVIYTIAYNVLSILIEKKDGIWDRMILSPVKKWEMYVSNLLYSFFEGYLQVIVIFLVFRYWFGIDFNGRFLEMLLLLFPYVFSIVALSIFITACVKNTQQFNAVLPIIAVSMAMIGGAYWPLEIVSSEILLALAKINPLTYGMEILNGVAVYGYSLEELLFPISILILMGVVFMGIGIHLMERRHV